MNKQILWKRRNILLLLFLWGGMIMIAGIARADKLIIPEGTKTIEIEAFYGDNSLDDVRLPDGILKICARAFANSGLKRINLPESLLEVDPTAFDGPDQVTIVAEGSWAEWAQENGYATITPQEAYEISIKAKQVQFTVAYEDTITLEVEVKNYDGQIDYVWTRSDRVYNAERNKMDHVSVDIPEAEHSSTYTISSVKKAATYNCVVYADDIGLAWPVMFSVHVENNIYINQSSSHIVVPKSDTVMLEVKTYRGAASGISELAMDAVTYQWTKFEYIYDDDGNQLYWQYSLINGETEPTYEVAWRNSEDEDLYMCETVDEYANVRQKYFYVRYE